MAELSEAAKERRRAYKREWAKQNREKTREYERKYWEKVARIHKEAEEMKNHENE